MTLVGKTVSAVYLAEDGKAIRFEVLEGNGAVVARAYGDCCSVTWIENVEAPEALIGSPVVAVEDIDMPNKAQGERESGDDYLQFYGCKITTAKGACVIDFRNESNGYYGGSLEWEKDYYPGVFGQNKSKEVWRLLAGKAAS